MSSRNIVEITDFNQDELLSIIEKSLKFKKNNHRSPKALEGKKVGLLFDSNSLRTRISFESAAYLLGGDSYFVDIDTVTNEKDGTPRETYEDIIETLDRMVDCYVIRDYSQKILEVIRRKDDPPFINGFCQTGHPSQALADLAVIKWKKGTTKGLNYTAVCDTSGSGVIESFIYGVLMLGESITIITPTGKLIGKNKDFKKTITNLEKQYNGKLNVTNEITSTIKNADVLYVDEWWEDDPDFLKKKIGKYKVDDKFLAGSKKDLAILHCLPAHPEREITKEIMYGPRSIIFDQAEFRVYSAMSLLNFIFNK